MMNILWGAMSPQMLQKAMALFEKELEVIANGTLDMAGVAGLAGIGARGKYASNCWLDLESWLPKPKLPPLHYLFLPLHHNILGRITKFVPMILPHKLFPAIFHNYPSMFDKLVGTADDCKRFWKSVSGSEQFRSHSCLL